ncbi:hypothetical protein MGG_14287 [Pyricularia oryzae 70-15]|uniref:Uncharacterized protein n=1 Tax=Pyricularia oryzae (strain 70-15 / ATCC MYA-4617 / FGSC 8958) TaxID=242507 RepID=G4NG39_PYRO7|nr:uncharacterized protein MGG_14287 [Pyricularia oryzae 70-15]EHA46996.1 hypothetical protein MGG_14287 [Pyricularia oryzae 70-15]
MTASHLVVNTVSWRVLLRGTANPDDTTTFRTWCKSQAEELGQKPEPDPSSTVAWFTTFTPLEAIQDPDQSSLQSLSKPVDQNLASIPLNGFSYFTSFHVPLPMEMTFNYLGSTVQVGS